MQKLEAVACRQDDRGDGPESDFVPQIPDLFALCFLRGLMRTYDFVLEHAEARFADGVRRLRNDSPGRLLDVAALLGASICRACPVGGRVNRMLHGVGDHAIDALALEGVLDVDGHFDCFTHNLFPNRKISVWSWGLSSLCATASVQ